VNKRLLLVLLFALISSGLVSLLVYRGVVSRLGAAKPSGKELVVASHNLAVGTLVKEPDLKVVTWSGTPPAQSVLRKEDAVGRGVIAMVYEGEPLLEGRLAPKGAGAGLAAMIPKGMRIVAVRVNEVIGLAGFVVPGMRVDVLINGVPPGGNRMERGAEVRTILQNIEVLSAGQNIQKDAEGKPVNVQVVNLLVAPDQAEALSLASNDAKIQLVLRNPLDNEKSKTTGVKLAKLFGAPDAAPAPVAPRPRAAAKPAAPKPAPAPAPVLVQVKVIETFHGGKKSETKFEKTAEVKP
jgi:pilus assembly protein CpaB